MSELDIHYCSNDILEPEEMLSLAEAVGFGPDRTLERNRKAIEGSVFIATARCENKLVGLVRLISDGAYILHIADIMVHPSFQSKGVGSHLLNSAIDFAKEKSIGTGDSLGEFTLFANLETEDFYSKHNFAPMPNAMWFEDSDSRVEIGQKARQYWESKRYSNNQTKKAR